MNTMYVAAVALISFVQLFIWGLYGFSLLGWAAGAVLAGGAFITFMLNFVLFMDLMGGWDE